MQWREGWGGRLGNGWERKGGEGEEINLHGFKLVAPPMSDLNIRFSLTTSTARMLTTVGIHDGKHPAKTKTTVAKTTVARTAVARSSVSKGE